MSSTHPRGRHPPIQAEERMAMVGGAESFSAIHPAGSVTVPPPKKKRGFLFLCPAVS